MPVRSSGQVPRHLGRALGSLAVAAVALTVLAPSTARPDERDAGFNGAEAQQVVALMDANPALARVYAACPADVFRQEAAPWEPLIRSRGVPLEICGTRPLSCLALCTTGSSGGHCFALARAFQVNQDQIKPRHAQMLFSMACATGMAGGCTNRAASIRNMRHEGDPFREAPEERKDLCQYRSFEIACGRRDAWGCAMLGQSHHYGEGVRADAAQARHFYQESCRISPAFAACEFSKSGIKALGRPAD